MRRDGEGKFNTTPAGGKERLPETCVNQRNLKKLSAVAKVKLWRGVTSTGRESSIQVSKLEGGGEERE